MKTHYLETLLDFDYCGNETIAQRYDFENEVFTIFFQYSVTPPTTMNVNGGELTTDAGGVKIDILHISDSEGVVCQLDIPDWLILAELERNWDDVVELASSRPNEWKELEDIATIPRAKETDMLSTPFPTAEPHGVAA